MHNIEDFKPGDFWILDIEALMSTPDNNNQFFDILESFQNKPIKIIDVDLVTTDEYPIKVDYSADSLYLGLTEFKFKCNQDDNPEYFL